MIIRKFKDSDAQEVSDLIQRTFMRFIAKSFTKNGVKNFLKHETPEKVAVRGRTRTVFVAVSGKKIVGIVEADKNRIRRLFVDESYQRKGIGLKLFFKMEKVCIREKPKFIKIYSSIYSVKFYEKVGYHKFGKVRKNKEGIVYQLMVKKFR